MKLQDVQPTFLEIFGDGKSMDLRNTNWEAHIISSSRHRINISTEAPGTPEILHRIRDFLLFLNQTRITPTLLHTHQFSQCIYISAVFSETVHTAMSVLYDV
jgi:hypothetical protein